MFVCRFIANGIMPFICLTTKRLRALGEVFEFVGWFAIVTIGFSSAIFGHGYANCISIISRAPSPDGRFSAVIKDCWPQSDFEQELIVNLVRPEEEGKLVSTVDSCDPPETAMLAIRTEDTRDRPLLDWVTPNHLEVSVPDNSKIILFRTRREGIVVNFVVEKTNDQKQRRKNKTSGEPDGHSKWVDNMHWSCVN